MSRLNYYYKAEWPMGALPPIIQVRIVEGQLYSRKVRNQREWELVGGGKLVLRPNGVAEGILGTLVTADLRVGRITWEVRVVRGGVYATQRTAWVHFIDSMGQDVTPYVHAAVARLAAQLAGLRVTSPANPESSCPKCRAFRVLPGSDIVLGDDGSRVPSMSTTALKEQGPVLSEKYWCSARMTCPPDIEVMVRRYNSIYRRGEPVGVLPLIQTGEDCSMFLPKRGIPAWEIHGGYASDPVIEESAGVRTLRVRGSQWEFVLSLKGIQTPIKEKARPQYIVVGVPGTDRKKTYFLSERGKPEMDILSYEAPLAKAALRACPGQEFIVDAPGGSYKLVRMA